MVQIRLQLCPCTWLEAKLTSNLGQSFLLGLQKRDLPDAVNQSLRPIVLDSPTVDSFLSKKKKSPKILEICKAKKSMLVTLGHSDNTKPTPFLSARVGPVG